MSTSTDKIKVGDKLPIFNTVTEDGTSISNESFAGYKTILYFYPKNDTPTCTKEACNLRDNFGVFKKNGYQVYGISPDNIKSHTKFIAKYELPFSLIADPDKSIIKSFGLFGSKKFMGKEVQGVYRTTIVIDENCTVTHVIENVVSGEHSKQLADLLGFS